MSQLTALSDFERQRLEHQLLTTWRTGVALDGNPLLRPARFGASWCSWIDLLAPAGYRVGHRTSPRTLAVLERQAAAPR